MAPSLLAACHFPDLTFSHMSPNATEQFSVGQALILKKSIITRLNFSDTCQSDAFVIVVLSFSVRSTLTTSCLPLTSFKRRKTLLAHQHESIR